MTIQNHVFDLFNMFAKTKTCICRNDEVGNHVPADRWLWKSCNCNKISTPAFVNNLVRDIIWNILMNIKNIKYNFCAL